MKFLKRISLFIVIPFGSLIIGILLGILSEDFDYESPQNVQNRTTDVQDTQTITVEATGTNILNSETIFIVEEMNLEDGKTCEKVYKLPEKYIGMCRDEFVETMEIYAIAPPLIEQQRGFVGVEVISFSKEKVVVQKNYALEEIMNEFYIFVEDHYLVVYLSDKHTVFMYTEIKLEELPQNIQQSIIDGMHMESEEKLYNFLESYSS